MHNRRKALVYVSDGYDFNPFQDSRLGLMDPNSPFLQNTMQRELNQEAKYAGRAARNRSDDDQPQQAGEFTDADLARELAS